MVRQRNQHPQIRGTPYGHRLFYSVPARTTGALRIMGWLYRCEKQYRSGPFKGQKCRQRHHFKKRVEEYVRPKKCPSCGNVITLLDRWQMKRNKQNTCLCAAYPFPHQAGSSVWCEQHPTGPTEEDQRHRYGG